MRREAALVGLLALAACGDDSSGGAAVVDVDLDLVGEGVCFPEGVQYQVSSIEIQLVDSGGGPCRRARNCIGVPGVLNLVSSADEIEEFLRNESLPLVSGLLEEVDRIEFLVFSQAGCAGEPDLCGDRPIPREGGVLELELGCVSASCSRTTADCSAARSTGAGVTDALTIVNVLEGRCRPAAD